MPDASLRRECRAESVSGEELFCTVCAPSVMSLISVTVAPAIPVSYLRSCN